MLHFKLKEKKCTKEKLKLNIFVRASHRYLKVFSEKTGYQNA